jgi:uncharacterized protein (TIGR00304 family)
MEAQSLYSIGIILTFAGILIITIASALIVLSKSKKSGRVRGGGVIMIGPIPIVFGTDKESLKTVLLLSIVLIVLLIVLILLLHFLST